MSNSAEYDSGHNFDPGEEFELNHLLIELANEITTDELKKLKFYIGGRGGSGKATLEGIADTMDYFNHLRQKNMLSMENLCTLQAFIWHLGRKDLYKKIVDFGREFEKKTLYFYTTKDTPENGYKYVRFHLKGNVNRAHVETTHLSIARLLRVPIEFVSIAGVEISNSIIITLMVPDECGEVLATLTDKEKSILNHIAIDYFTMDEKKYLVTDTDFVEDTDDVEVASQLLMKKLDKTEKELDICHADLIKYKRNINEKEAAFMYWQLASVALKYYLFQQTNKDMFPLPQSLQHQASFKHLNVLMEKAKALGYDRKLLDEMLVVNENIVKMKIRLAYQMIIQHQQLEIDVASKRVIEVEYTNQRLSFLLGKKLEETEGNWNSLEFLQYVAMQREVSVPIIEVDIQSISLDDETVKLILYEITKELKQEEKTLLFKSSKMDKKEEQRYKRDQNTLLEIIWLKTRKQGVPFDMGEFIRQCLQKVNRQDLFLKHSEIIRRIVQEKQDIKRHSESETRAKTQPKEKHAQESKTEQSPDIRSRLQKMEGLLEQLVNMSTCQSKVPYFDDKEKKKFLAKLYFSQKYSDIA